MTATKSCSRCNGQVYTVLETDSKRTLCMFSRANADEMAAVLQDLGSMQVTASDLRNQIMNVDANINQVGRAYLCHLVESQEHSTISSNLKQSQQVLHF